jgi:uncharacterized membrane protein
MNKRQMFGSMIAMAAAGMLVANASLADDKKAEAKKEAKKTVKCMGVNECKGKGGCASADGKNACAGKNECKGKGVSMTATDADCTKAGGTVVKPAEKKAEEKKS